MSHFSFIHRLKQFYPRMEKKFGFFFVLLFVGQGAPTTIKLNQLAPKINTEFDNTGDISSSRQPRNVAVYGPAALYGSRFIPYVGPAIAVGWAGYEGYKALRSYWNNREIAGPISYPQPPRQPSGQMTRAQCNAMFNTNTALGDASYLYDFGEGKKTWSDTGDYLFDRQFGLGGSYMQRMLCNNLPY